MIARALGFLTGIPRQVWLYLIVGALALTLLWVAYDWAYDRGASNVRAEWDAANDAAERAAAKKKVAQAAVSRAVEAKHADQVQAVRTVTRTIVREVPVYVPADSCDLPGGFRVLHDAAAAGRVPDPARVVAAPTVPAATAAATVAENYGTCHETETQLRALIEWHEKQAKLK